MSKKVVINSVDMRKFVESVLAVGAVGGVMDSTCVSRKGLMLVAEVIVPDEAVVPVSQNVKITALSRAAIVRAVQDNQEKGIVRFTKEELECMTKTEVAQATGLQGNKKDMIEAYLKDEIQE